MIKILRPITIFKLLLNYYQIEKSIIWTDYGQKRQAGLQFKVDEDPWSSGVGTSTGNEVLYNNLNPFFKNTIFENIITEFKLSRTRLMWVNPMSCYSMHKDTTPRIHIPMITNPECYFVFKKGIIQHMPIGSVYWTNTVEAHTFMNCSNSPRLHLIGVVDYDC
jgi:hypothetical protein